MKVWLIFRRGVTGRYNLHSIHLSQESATKAKKYDDMVEQWWAEE